jgi:hypothetical protein
MKNKRKYYPNNWKVIKDAPSEVFEPCEFEFMFDKEWQLRPGAVGIVRTMNRKTGKVEEFSYKQEKSLKDTHDITIVTDELIATNYPIED